jgi:hypothetical protein
MENTMNQLVWSAFHIGFRSIFIALGIVGLMKSDLTVATKMLILSGFGLGSYLLIALLGGLPHLYRLLGFVVAYQRETHIATTDALRAMESISQHAGATITKTEYVDPIRDYDLPENSSSDNLGVLMALYAVPTVVITLVLLSIWPDILVFGYSMRGK